MVGMVTRWFASVNTQYNIVFGGVNFLRDLGAASLNLSTTEIAGKEKQVRANVLPALRAIYRELRGKGATTEAMAEMQDWFERFQLAGGQTGYQNQFAETKRKGNVVEQLFANRINPKQVVFKQQNEGNNDIFVGAILTENHVEKDIVDAIALVDKSLIDSIKFIRVEQTNF
jgi:hypothetical protein